MILLIVYGIGALVTFVCGGIFSASVAKEQNAKVRWGKVIFKAAIWPVFWMHLFYVFFEALFWG